MYEYHASVRRQTGSGNLLRLRCLPLREEKSLGRGQSSNLWASGVDPSGCRGVFSTCLKEPLVVWRGEDVRVLLVVLIVICGEYGDAECCV
jgi:hypothetical protein